MHTLAQNLRQRENLRERFEKPRLEANHAVPRPERDPLFIIPRDTPESQSVSITGQTTSMRNLPLTCTLRDIHSPRLFAPVSAAVYF